MAYDWVSDRVSMTASGQELRRRGKRVRAALARSLSLLTSAVGHVPSPQGDGAARGGRQAASDGIWGHK